MDVTQALKDTENSLRDFIATVLQKKISNDWEEHCGVSPERVEVWKERKLVEEKRQKSGVIEERLIYYADFYDLKTILKKHWSGEFSEALNDWKTIDVWLSELEKLRDPDAHRRELLPHQKHLALGIAGEIRTRLIRYRSKQETSEDYFPRIESIRDNLGNIYVAGRGVVGTLMNLRPGDVIEYVITASDPLGDDLRYAVSAKSPLNMPWQNSNVLSLTILDEHIAKNFTVALAITSPREFHADVGGIDDIKFFEYNVLPSKI